MSMTAAWDTDSMSAVNVSTAFLDVFFPTLSPNQTSRHFFKAEISTAEAKKAPPRNNKQSTPATDLSSLNPLQAGCSSLLPSRAI